MYMYKSIYKYLYTYLSIFMCVCMCVPTQTCAYAYACVCVFVFGPTHHCLTTPAGVFTPCNLTVWQETDKESGFEEISTGDDTFE